MWPKTKTRLPRIKELLEEQRRNGGGRQVYSYRVPGGPVIGTGLHKDDEVSVQDCFLPAGCVFTDHLHDYEAETLTIVTGRVVVKSRGGSRIMLPGSSITHKPGVSHEVSALEDTRLIATAVPGDEGYPDGPS